MKILIVDDTPEKISRIREAIMPIAASIDYSIAECSSATEAAILLRTTQYDLLVLDMLLPWRVGAEPAEDSGTRLLELIGKQAHALLTPKYIVGLTAFEKLIESLSVAFTDRTWQLLKYDPSSSEWETRLTSLVVHIADVLRSQDTFFGIDLAVVTALHHVELASVLALPGEWVEFTNAGDDTIYHRGVFRRGNKHVNLVAAACPEMGMPAATALAMKVIGSFRPRYLGMVGIAAGVKGNFGDVLVASHSWDYGSGKTVEKKGESRFEPTPSQIPLDPVMAAKVNRFLMKRADVVPSISERWDGPKAVTTLELQIGHLASGAAVVAHRPVIDAIASMNRKLIGIEMEIYGLFMAARSATSPRPLAFAMKSICDFADGLKDDAYQSYAAFTSAQLMYEFALDQLGVPSASVPA